MYKTITPDMVRQNFNFLKIQMLHVLFQKKNKRAKNDYYIFSNFFMDILKQVKPLVLVIFLQFMVRKNCVLAWFFAFFDVYTDKTFEFNKLLKKMKAYFFYSYHDFFKTIFITSYYAIIKIVLKKSCFGKYFMRPWFSTQYL